MREINLNEPANAIPHHTYLVYGQSRAGKTRFASTFSRPLFLSDATEGGWETIKHMDDEDFFEVGRRPKVLAIENIGDMTTALAKADPMIASGEVHTIVIDSLSFYVDLYLNHVFNTQAKRDTRAAYGDLGIHLRDLRVKVHARPVNVVWLCLAKEPDESDPIGGPMIPGQQAAKFAAGCHFIFYARSYQEKRGQELLPAQFEMRTRKFQNYLAGNRLGGMANQLPDPLIGSYVDLVGSLGYELDDLRNTLKAVPKLPIELHTKPAVPVKPVVAVAPKPAIVARPAQPVARPAVKPS